jgi:superfamily II DNA or RNA helicase
MKVIIEPNHLIFEGPPDLQNTIMNRYSFRDSAAEYALNRAIRRGIWLLSTGFWARNGKFKTKEEFLTHHNATEEKWRSKLDVFCCEKQGANLRVPIGLYQNLAGYLGAQGQPFEIQDRRNFNLPRRTLTGFCHPMRRPQVDALRALLPQPIGMLRMATGVGKTLVGQEIIRHLGHPSIFLVPSRPILFQTAARFRAAFGSRHVGVYGGGKKKLAHVTVATYQSVYAADPGDFDDYDVVIADECHHVPADTYYEVVENKLRNAVYRYGLTADEERSDGGTVLVEAATGPILFSYDAPQAIREGFLAQPTFVIYEIRRTEGWYIKWKTDDNGDRIAIGTEQSEATDEDDSHLAYKNWILGNDLLNREISNIANAFAQSGSSVLILIDEREHGDKLMAYLKQYGAELVTGDTDGNEDVQARFNRRELKLVVATSTWGEGSDTPPVDVLINLMGGTKTKQANGRALRNDPGEDGVPRKPTCLIIDFDVPVSPPLNRHSVMRCEVHQECGPVHYRTLI